VRNLGVSSRGGEQRKETPGFNSLLPVSPAKSTHFAVNVMMRLSIKLPLLAVILLPNRSLTRDYPHASVGILFPVGEGSIDRKGLSQ